MAKKKVDYNDLLDTAIVNIGLKPNEFWEMRFVDFMRLVIHKAKEDANEWDRTRVITSMILNTNVGKSHQLKPTQFMPLWTDKLGKKKKRITEADRDRILESIRRTEECQKN